LLIAIFADPAIDEMQHYQQETHLGSYRRAGTLERKYANPLYSTTMRKIFGSAIEINFSSSM
jgi:hypothetical protein